MMSDVKNILIGRKLLSVKLAPDRTAIRFDTDSGEITAPTNGDYCSQPWIDTLELHIPCLPATVLSVDDLENRLYQNNVCRCVITYGCKVETDRGDIFIDYCGSVRWGIEAPL